MVTTNKFGKLSVSPVTALLRMAAEIGESLAMLDKDAGIGPGEFDVLAALELSDSEGALAVPELAEASHTKVATGALSKRLDRLAAAGLVERLAVEGDGRSRLVRLTDAGRVAVTGLAAARAEREAELLASLASHQRTDLEYILGAWWNARA